MSLKASPILGQRSILLATKIDSTFRSPTILDNDFKIDPKITGGKNVSCQYCPFKDICYYDHRHLIVLDNDEEEEAD